MKNPETVALHTIYKTLKSGASYGKDIFRWPNGNGPRFPYFSTAIYYKPGATKETRYFCWTHAGSSANRATLKDLKWIIEVIFETTPAQFQKDYITSTESKIPA